MPRSTRLQLLFLTPHFAPHFEGGTELVARSQARELAALGHRVRVLSGTDRPWEAADLERAQVDGLEVGFVPRRPDESYDLELERPRLRALIEDALGEAELAHVHHWSTLTGTLVRDLSRRVPVVVTLHDLFVTCPRFFRVPQGDVASCPAPERFEPCARCVSVDAPGHSLDALEHGLRRRADAFRAELDAARLVIFPSESHARAVGAHVPLDPRRSRVVHHGLGQPIDAVGAEWSGAGPLRLLFLGNRARVKGVLDLGRALSALGDALERVELHLIGAEVEAGLDAELTRLVGTQRAIFHPSYSPEELSERVAALGPMHLALLPSRVSESYALVVDEALALGLPVWVSDRGAPRERVGAAGQVLPAQNPEAWAEALHEVLRRPDILERQRAAVPSGGRTAKDAALELQELYRELLTPAP